MLRYFLPLLLLAAITALFYAGLRLNPGEVPSPLVGKPAPEFELELLDDPGRTFTHTDLRGQVTLVHVWATWCVTCRAEHPTLMEFAARGVVPVIGFNYKDERADALRWLDTLGDPYRLTVYDPRGAAGLDWGVYGTPETFVVDADGIIRYKHIGPLTEEIIEQTLLPLLRELGVEEA